MNQATQWAQTAVRTHGSVLLEFLARPVFTPRPPKISAGLINYGYAGTDFFWIGTYEGSYLSLPSEVEKAIAAMNPAHNFYVGLCNSSKQYPKGSVFVVRDVGTFDYNEWEKNKSNAYKFDVEAKQYANRYLREDFCYPGVGSVVGMLGCSDVEFLLEEGVDAQNIYALEKDQYQYKFFEERLRPYGINVINEDVYTFLAKQNPQSVYSIYFDFCGGLKQSSLLDNSGWISKLTQRYFVHCTFDRNVRNGASMSEFYTQTYDRYRALRAQQYQQLSSTLALEPRLWPVDPALAVKEFLHYGVESINRFTPPPILSYEKPRVKSTDYVGGCGLSMYTFALYTSRLRLKEANHNTRNIEKL